MNIYNRISLLLILSITILTSACKKDKRDCSGVSCTEEFRTITVSVKDKDGKAVVLDDYYTFLDSRNRFKVEDDSNTPGEYPLVSDAEIDQVSFEGTSVIFVGVIDETNVVEHQLVIGKDCCHIQLLNGNRSIVID